MRYIMTKIFTPSLILASLAAATFSPAAYSATDAQVMNGIIAAAGNVDVFNASRTVTISLTAGTTDAIASSNSAAISNAINSAAAGTAIQLPSGDYSVANEIFIKKSNVALQGTMNGSAWATTIHCTKSLTNIHPEYARMGNSAPSHGGGGILTISSADNVHIRNFAIHFSTRTRYKYNDGYNAIYLNKATNCSVRNMKIDDFEIAVSSVSAVNCLIDGLTLNSVRGAHFAINLGEKTTRTKVDHLNCIGGISHDLSLQGCSNNVFQNCVLDPGKAYGSGIDFRGGYAPITNNVFKNIRVYDNPLSGNNAIKGTSYDFNPLTFGHCYYSNVIYRGKIFSSLPGDDKYKDLINYIHFISDSTPPPNVAPIVSAGADKTATLSSSSAVVNVSGSAIDADGDVLTKLWSKVSGPANVTFSAPTATVTNVTFTALGTYVLRLTANDGHNHIISDDVQIIVSSTAVNVAPVVNASADKSVTLSSASVVVSLSGSVADADGDVTTKQWSKFSGPANVTFSAPTVAVTNVTFTTVGTYVLRLTANDGHNHIVSDDVQVVISPTAFTRRINMNGTGATIGGKAWTAYSSALTQGLSVSPQPLFANTKLTPSPVVDAATAGILNTAIWNTATFTINQTLPNGNYTVTLWVMENFLKSNNRAFDVSMEGAVKATGIGSLALGAWQKYTYSTSVMDGQLNITLTPRVGQPHVMGLEIVSVSAVATLDVEQLIGSWIKQ